MKKDLTHLVKYFLIGCTASAIDVITFYILTTVMSFGILSSNAVSIGISASFSFGANAYLNFYRTDKLFVRGFKFFIVILIGYLVSSGLIYIQYFLFNFNENVAKVVTLPIIFILQYYLNSRFSFK